MSQLLTRQLVTGQLRWSHDYPSQAATGTGPARAVAQARLALPVASVLVRAAGSVRGPAGPRAATPVPAAKSLTRADRCRRPAGGGGRHGPAASPSPTGRLAVATGRGRAAPRRQSRRRRQSAPVTPQWSAGAGSRMGRADRAHLPDRSRGRSHSGPGLPGGPGPFVVTGRQEPRHFRDRPSWDCPACGQPWPCVQAKEELLSEFRRHPSSLTIYMSSYMGEALNDLTAHGEAPPPDLYERFLSWVRPSATGLSVEAQDFSDDQ